MAPFKKIEAEGFRGAALVVDGGKVLARQGFGPIALGKPALMQPNTVFPIGSVAKWFTGILVLKLQAKGVIGLNDTVGAIFPKAPEDKRKITVRQLLAHTAGLGEYVDRQGEGGDFALINRDEATRRILNGKLLFKPGAKSEYSNQGYTLLASMIEARCKMPFEKAMRQHVLVPAGLQRTGFYGELLAPKDEFAVGSGAKSHGSVNAGWAWGKPTWSVMGAGGMVSTVDDMGRLIGAIVGGKVIPPSHEPRLFEPLSMNEGYGWMVGKSKAGTPFCNVGGGDDFGFHTSVFYLPQEGRVVVACSAGDTPRKVSDASMQVLRSLSGSQNP